MTRPRVVAAVLTAALVLALLLVPTLVDASHIVEPKRPIVSMTDPIIYVYPGRANAIPCDGSATWTSNLARLEADVRADPLWPDKQAPSEHWTIRVNVEVKHPGGSGTGTTVIWSDLWNHSNIPPHNGNAPSEVLQVGMYNIQDTPGEWRVKLTLTTLETKVTYVRECRFQVVPVG